MLNFKSFIAEAMDHTVHDLGGGSVVYSHAIGQHTVQTHFFPRNDRGDYDVHFTRHSGDNADSSSRKGVGKIPSSDRVKMIHSVTHATKHFVSTKNPASLTASANTKDKRSWSTNLFSHVAKRRGGSVESRAGETTLKLR